MDMDKAVENLFEIVQTRRSKLNAAQNTIVRQWNTNCSIKLPWQPTPTNIQTASEESLVHIKMYLNQYLAAKDLLGIDGNDIQGYSNAQWNDDLKKRIAMIGIRQQQKELDEAESKLNTLVSPEQRRKMDLEALSKQLGV